MDSLLFGLGEDDIQASPLAKPRDLNATITLQLVVPPPKLAEIGRYAVQILQARKRVKTSGRSTVFTEVVTEVVRMFTKRVHENSRVLSEAALKSLGRGRVE
eukprot:1185833-Prorocentrum_minimum.AAC.1